MPTLVTAGKVDLGDACDRAAGDTYGRGSSWRGLAVIDTPRFRELDFKQSFFRCQQHDHKRFDFDGRVIASGGSPLALTQPLLSAAQAPFYVPLAARRPSSPYRLPRAMVKAFTALLFGESRFPKLAVMGDLASDDFSQAVVEATNLPIKAVSLRDFGGQCGSFAYSWGYVEGRPRVNVLNTKNLFVHSWDDREELVPRHVTRALLYPRDIWDPERKRFVRAYYWHRRDWTPDVDIVFKSLRYENGVDPADQWEPDLGKSVQHNDGVCHVVWGQNKPSEDVDGEADYEGQYENFNELDIILSIVLRGAKLNLDPTLVVKADRDLVNRVGLRKGSDNALITDKDGDAKYLELAGTSLKAGLEVFNEYRRTILDACQCVMPDPDKIASAAVSSVALKMLYKPMLAEGEILRGMYGQALARGVEHMIVTARRMSDHTVTVYDEETGEEIEAQPELDMSPRIDAKPVTDEDGRPTGEDEYEFVERHPGEAEDVVPKWPQWFPPTPADISQTTTAVTTAVGVGTSVMSQQTGAEIVAQAYGLDPAEEHRRVQKQAAEAQANTESMFSDATGDAGGRVEHTQQLPGGGQVKRFAGAPHPRISPGHPGPPGAQAPPEGPLGGVPAPKPEPDEGEDLDAALKPEK